jgi:hypothetical protein
MATVLDGCTTEEQRLVVRFCEQKTQLNGYTQRIFSYLWWEVFVV